MSTRTCKQCGFDFTQITRGGRRHYCLECRPSKRPAPRGLRNKPSGESPGYRLALAVTDLRLAVEIAATALRTGRPAVALAALEKVRR